MITKYNSQLFDAYFINNDHKTIRIRSSNPMISWKKTNLPCGSIFYYKDCSINEVDSLYTIKFYGKYNKDIYLLDYDIYTKKVRITSESKFSGSYMVERGVYRKKIDLDDIECFMVEYTDIKNQDSENHKISRNQFIELYQHNIIETSLSTEETRISKSVIINYLISNNNMDMSTAGAALSKLEHHKDLLLEFFEVIETGEFNEKHPITIEGYTSKHIKELTNLTILDSYLYLIYLRNLPTEAIINLKKITEIWGLIVLNHTFTSWRLK